MTKFHLMTMDRCSTEPFYHGLVEIDDNGYVQGPGYGDDGTPVEDYGYYFFTKKAFPTDREWMLEKFLSLK